MNDDYIILKSGYDNAINDILPLIEDEILKYKIKKIQKNKFNQSVIYNCDIYKYYFEKEELGIIIFEDSETIKGIYINLDTSSMGEMKEKDLIYTKIHYKFYSKQNFSNKELAELTYQNLINKWK